MFLDAIQRKIDPDQGVFPWSMPLFRWLDRLEFKRQVTFLVGENGSGKSTLLEGLAAGMDAVVAGRRPISSATTASPWRGDLAAGYRFSRRRRPRARLFVRAEDHLFGFVRRGGPRHGRPCADRARARREREGRLRPPARHQRRTRPAPRRSPTTTRKTRTRARTARRSSTSPGKAPGGGRPLLPRRA